MHLFTEFALKSFQSLFTTVTVISFSEANTPPIESSARSNKADDSQFRESFRKTPRKALAQRGERDEAVTAYTFQHKGCYLESERDLVITAGRLTPSDLFVLSS